MTADNTDKDRALSEIRSDIEVTREKLAQTLDAIEERLDVPKRAKKALADGIDWFEAQRQQNPTIVYGVLGAAGAVVVGAGALVVRGLRR